MAMKLGKENVRIVFEILLDEIDLWNPEGKDAEKLLAYISGAKDMANAVMEAIEDLGGT